MRRLIHLIVLALLTLAGPAGALRPLGNAAAVACPCGCGAPSEEGCGCAMGMPGHGPSASKAPADSRCPAPGSTCSLRAPVAAVGLAEEQREESTPRSEPRPWPLGLAVPVDVSKVALRPAPGPASRGSRALDRQARLETFRI